MGVRGWLAMGERSGLLGAALRGLSIGAVGLGTSSCYLGKSLAGGDDEGSASDLAASAPGGRCFEPARDSLKVVAAADDKVWKVNDKGERESWQTACYYNVEGLGGAAPSGPNQQDDSAAVSRMSFSCVIRVPAEGRLASNFCSAYFSKFKKGRQAIYVRKYVNKCAEARVLNARADSIPYTEGGFVTWLEKNYFDICARHVFHLDPETGLSAVRDAQGYDFKKDVAELLRSLVVSRVWPKDPLEPPPVDANPGPGPSGQPRAQ